MSLFDGKPRTGFEQLEQYGSRVCIALVIYTALLPHHVGSLFLALIDEVTR